MLKDLFPILKAKMLTKQGILVLLLALITLGGVTYGVRHFLYQPSPHPLVLQQKGSHTTSHTSPHESQSHSKDPLEPSVPSKTPSADPITKETNDNVSRNAKIADFFSFACLTSPQDLILIVTGLGLDAQMTERAIRELPDNVVLSFSPFAKMINQWIQPARAAGHELLIELNNEKDLENMGIITYFDGVLMMPGKKPIASSKVLKEFLWRLNDQQKIIIEGRLLARNYLLHEAQLENFPIYALSHTLTQDTVFTDQQDILTQQGIVTVSSSLIPYLIDYFNHKNSSDIKLSRMIKEGKS